jgi:hypothetical protein
LTKNDVREYIAEVNPLAVVFDNPSFDGSIIGVTDDDCVVYDYNKMVEELAADDGMSLEDAADFISYNTIRAIPYAGAYAPVIMYRLED